MNNETVDNFISLDNTILCHYDALFSSFNIGFEYNLDNTGEIKISKCNNEDTFIFDSIVRSINSGKGKFNVPVNIKNISGNIELAIIASYENKNKKLIEKKFIVKINKCNVFAKNKIIFQSNKRFHKCNLTKKIESEYKASLLGTTPTPTQTSSATSTEDLFIYNPVETPTPSPMDIDPNFGTINGFGGWFNFDEVIAQIPFDYGKNSPIPLVFKNASFDFSKFPELDLINPDEDIIDLLFYITRGNHTETDPWNLYHDTNLETAKAYGVWHENLDFVRGYEEFSLKPQSMVFSDVSSPFGGLTKALADYKNNSQAEAL